MQVVMKSIETNYQKVEGLSAATILGDGQVAFILDLPGLGRLARQNR
jgi:two-component system chemotaxis sensor kinase CheA